MNEILRRVPKTPMDAAIELEETWKKFTRVTDPVLIQLEILKELKEIHDTLRNSLHATEREDRSSGS